MAVVSARDFPPGIFGVPLDLRGHSSPLSPSHFERCPAPGARFPPFTLHSGGACGLSDLTWKFLEGVAVITSGWLIVSSFLQLPPRPLLCLTSPGVPRRVARSCELLPEPFRETSAPP